MGLSQKSRWFLSMSNNKLLQSHPVILAWRKSAELQLYVSPPMAVELHADAPAPLSYIPRGIWNMHNVEAQWPDMLHAANQPHGRVGRCINGLRSRPIQSARMIKFNTSIFSRNLIPAD